MPAIPWPLNEAKRLLKAYPSQTTLRLETGFGPSGLPHIGTFAEVARTLCICIAAKQYRPDIQLELIVFSDDKDGLRSIPENVPNAAMLKEHLGKPLSSIPDPFGETQSYSGYMNKQLCLFLDSYGFDYTFCSSSKLYGEGKFDAGLQRITEEYDTIKQLFTATISQEKRDSWSPFFPICEQCGKIYTTKVTDINKANYELSYSCETSTDSYVACGHKGTIPITGTHVKVGWKVDWALRWYILNINYEMYGKDLMESATLSAKICRVLGGKAPVPYKYEMFLDANGAKISKKIGNGISMEQWINYAPLGALLHFLLGNPNKAKKMGMSILPRLIDDYVNALRTDTEQEEYSALFYLSKLQNQTIPVVKSQLSFALLLNVAQSIAINDASLLYNYALNYDASVQENEEFYKQLCGYAIKLAQYNQQYQETVTVKNPQWLPLLKQASQTILALPESEFDGNTIQTLLFTVAKENDLPIADWFAFLYQSLLQQEQGPKLGYFFAILGKEQTAALLEQKNAC